MKYFPEFKIGTWNFNEAGHGKGVPVVISSVINQIVDNAVAQEINNPDEEIFFETVKENIR